MKRRFQCRTQHCVCRDDISTGYIDYRYVFQCRTQHCVCRDLSRKSTAFQFPSFNAARSIVCVGTTFLKGEYGLVEVSMPHAALCVSRQDTEVLPARLVGVSMPHAALCVSRRCVPQPLSRTG